MKILVTGGNGFLGSHIAKQLLKQGHDLISIQRSDPVVIQKIEGVDYKQGDLTDLSSFESFFEGVDAVFHVAAFAGVWGPWEEFYDANVVATQNVVAACKKHKIRSLVYTSTPSVVFSGDLIQGGDESMPYGSNWLCHYAHTKQIAEEFVLSDAVAKDMDVIALRPHLIWGAGDPHLLPRLIRRARDGGLKIVGKGDNKVDITHVSNATQAHLDAFEKLCSNANEVRQKAYFISDGEPVNLWNWIQSLLEQLHIVRIKRKLPFSLVYKISHFMEWWYQTFKLQSEPPMTRFVAVELAKDHYFNIDAAKQELGYQPKQNEEFMQELIAYLQDL